MNINKISLVCLALLASNISMEALNSLEALQFRLKDTATNTLDKIEYNSLTSLWEIYTIHQSNNPDRKAAELSFVRRDLRSSIVRDMKAIVTFFTLTTALTFSLDALKKSNFKNIAEATEAIRNTLLIPASITSIDLWLKILTLAGLAFIN